MRSTAAGAGETAVAQPASQVMLRVFRSALRVGRSLRRRGFPPDHAVAGSESGALVRQRDDLIFQRDDLIRQRDGLGRAFSNWELAGLSPPTFPRRAVVNGFPGAGNVLAERICSALLLSAAGAGDGPVAAVAQDPLAAIMLGAIGARYNRLMSLLRGALPEAWPGECWFTLGATGEVLFVANDGVAFLLTSGIDVGAHLNAAVHSSHERPTKASEAFYVSQGLSVVTVVRHPLDILISFAAKQHAMADRDKAAVVGAGLTVKDFARSVRLADDSWLFRYATLLRQYYESALARASAQPPTRYETALEDPLGYVLSLAARLGVAVDESAAARIAGIIGRDEFSPGHFNQPGVAKWRSYFTRRQLDLLQPTGLFDLFAAFGYRAPEADDLLDTVDDLPESLRNYRPERSNPAEYLSLAGAFGVEALRDHLGLQGVVHTLRHGRHVLAGNDLALLTSFSSRLQRAVFNELVG